MFSGAFTALVTPFRNGEVDVEALEGMVEFQIQGGKSTAGKHYIILIDNRASMAVRDTNPDRLTVARNEAQPSVVPATMVQPGAMPRLADMCALIGPSAVPGASVSEKRSCSLLVGPVANILRMVKATSRSNSASATPGVWK